MDPHRRTSMLFLAPRSRRDGQERPSLLARIRRRFGVREHQEERELPLSLSLEGSAEVLDEIETGSPLTPERAAMLERVRAREEIRARVAGLETCAKVIDPYRRTPMLSPEGSREVEAEMAGPPADTPGRRALFERVEIRAAMRRRVEEMERSIRKS